MTWHGRDRWPRRATAWPRFIFKAGHTGHFFAYAARRFVLDGGPRQAAGLSYASLLAIVPLLAVGLSFLAGFPAFAERREELQAFVLKGFLPDTGLEVGAYFTTFVENASKMTAPGLFGLALTALLLMSSINSVLNQTWRVAEPRPLAARLVVYWTLLTLGPLFIGASLSVSSFAFAAVQWFHSAALGGVIGLSKLISTLLSMLGFATIYLVVPNRSVHPAHAFMGGLIAAILFEVLKAFFGLYLRFFPSYQLVYGAVSTIPIFLIWMYLSWVVTLFGAQVAAALPEWRAARARGEVAAGPGARLALALSLLARLRDAARAGERLKERSLARGLPVTPAELDETLSALRQGGYAERVRGGRWVLCRDLAAVSLGDLTRALDLTFDPGEGWHPGATAVVAGLAGAAGETLERSVAAALTGAGSA